MGFSICLMGKDKTVLVPRHNEGANRQCRTDGSDGTTAAEILFATNYDLEAYHQMIGKILKFILDGHHAKDTIPLLTKAVNKCGTINYNDYFGGPKYDGRIVALMLAWAKLHPDAVWKVFA